MDLTAKGVALDMHRYNQALNVRADLMAKLNHFLHEWDAWLCPVSPTAAFTHRARRATGMLPDISSAGVNLPYLEGSISMTVPFSLTGNPVVCLPTGLSEGLPVGIQLVGRYGEDEALLNVAAQLEMRIRGFSAPA